MTFSQYIIVPFCLVSCAALMLGCTEQSGGGASLSQYSQSFSGRMSAEKILASTGGPWNIVELEQGGDAHPDSLHDLARASVNTKSTRSGQYVRKYDPRDQDINYRILQVEPAAGGSSRSVAGKINEDIGVASSLWPVPYHKPDSTKPAKVRVAVAPPVSVKARKKITPVVASPVKIAKASTSITQPMGSFVSDVRFGVHPDKTRMVLDVSDKTKFSHAMIDGDKVLEVTLEGAAWDAGQRLKILNHPFILGYRAKTDANQTVLRIKLKESARVKWATSFAPSGTKGYRLVFDIVTL